MKKHFLSIALCGLLAFASAAQTGRMTSIPPYAGSISCSPEHTDVFSFVVNQASLAQLKKMTVGVLGERRFMLPELGNYIVVAAIPTHSGNFGMQMSYAGFSEYNEIQGGIAYARPLGKKIDLGIQFNYNGMRIAGYGKGSAISAGIGTMLHLTDKLHAGIHVSHPAGGKFGKNKEEKLPAVYSFGLGYSPSEKFFFGISVIKEEQQPVNVNAGMLYKPISPLLLKVGISTATSSFWAGVGWMVKSIRIDLNTSCHPQLGISSGLLFIFQFHKEQ